MPEMVLIKSHIKHETNFNTTQHKSFVFTSNSYLADCIKLIEQNLIKLSLTDSIPVAYYQYNNTFLERKINSYIVQVCAKITGLLPVEYDPQWLMPS